MLANDFGTESGLMDDYMNVWGVRKNELELILKGIYSKERAPEILQVPIESYEAHLRRKYPIDWEEHLDRAVPAFRQRLDKTVGEYNSLPLEKKMDWETLLKYWKICTGIIDGNIGG
ncbi:hypothetical protein HYU13_03645 [Candidatus Woesearchaeota archaeon]|nr:hypothetical protein [Candidatus Woesearchaeota archaeon]